MLLAEHAGLLLAAVRDRGRQAHLAGERDALAPDGGWWARPIGVIMTQRGCPPGGPRGAAQRLDRLHIPVREVAQRLISTVARPRQN